MKTQECYWTLLREAIWNTPENICMDNIDIEAIVSISLKQGTAPLIFDKVLLIHDSQCTMHDELQMQMKQVCMQNMMLQQEMKGVLATAWEALSNCGVQPVLLKGFGLAKLYPLPHLRQWGDIDIYVGDVGYHQTAEMLRNTFPNCACYEEEEEYFKHWNINVGNTAIEAHRVSAVLTHPCDMRLWQRLERDAMIHAQEMDIEGMKLRIPEYRFNTLFVFLHSWHHFTESGSATMKQLCDLVLLLHSASLQSAEATIRPNALLDYLKKNLRQLCLTQVWQAYAYIMVTYLGLPADECPLYTPKAAKRGERLLNRILNPVRATSHTATRHTNVLLRKLSTLRNKIHDSLQTWPISPVYAIHDIIGKVLEGLSRLLRGELNRKWE